MSEIPWYNTRETSWGWGGDDDDTEDEEDEDDEDDEDDGDDDHGQSMPILDILQKISTNNTQKILQLVNTCQYWYPI